MVCTANVARSPLLEALLQHEADRRLGSDAVRVRSAGTHAGFGVRAAEGSAMVARRFGLDLAPHLSRPLMQVRVPDAALIIGMTRHHVRDIGAHAPGVAPQSFTLPELLTCIDDGPEPPPVVSARSPRAAIEEVAAWAEDRRPRFGRWDRRLDVPDPIGGDQAVYDALGVRFERATSVLAAALFGPAPDGRADDTGDR